MTEIKTVGSTTNSTLKLTLLEKDALNIGRILNEEDLSLVYRYQHYLASKMIESADPVERIGKNLIFATPNSDVWRELSLEIMSSTADVLLVSISAEYESAMVHEYADGNPEFLYLTYDHIEVLELIENALGAFENSTQDQFEEYQRTHSTGIQKLASLSFKGGDSK